MAAGYNKMAAVSDWLEDMRQLDLELERDVLEDRDGYYSEYRELLTAGVSFGLAHLILAHTERDQTKPLEDQAEAAMLDKLLRHCPPCADDPEQMAILRKQAAYARKLCIRMKFLERNLRRDLDRLDRRRAGTLARRRHVFPHHGLRRLTLRQSREARYQWEHGATHGLSYHRALHTTARQDQAVYQRMRRILQKVMSM